MICLNKNDNESKANNNKVIMTSIMMTVSKSVQKLSYKYGKYKITVSTLMFHIICDIKRLNNSEIHMFKAEIKHSFIH